MEPYRMSMKLGSQARLLLTQGDQELLRAALPPPARFWSGKPAKALLESLAIWLDARLRVVLDARDPDDGFYQDLTDELGTGSRTLYYEIACVERRRRHRSMSLRGAPDFRDLQQMCLLDRLAGGER